MNTQGQPAAVSEESLDQACTWIARLRSDTVSRADRKAFARWMQTGENHLAFDQMAELWGDLGVLSQMPVEQLFPESITSTSRPPREMAAPSRPNPVQSLNPTHWLMGGGLVAACLVVTLWAGGLWFDGGDPEKQIYITRLGETKTVTLADGSQVQLNTNSELHVAFSRAERHTELLRGEAFFDVVRQTSRPFTVAAGRANIRVLGTEFNVERNFNNARVSVTSGTVAVTEARTASGLQPESVKLQRNQKVSVSTRGLSDVSPTSADEALDWTRGVLVFDNTALSDALDELNRYLSVPAAADQSIRDRAISGTFELSNPDNALKAIAAALDLRLDHSNPHQTLLSPKPN
ncbi:FecR family protein [Microbulbifer sp. 2201CG32-9]|uniref:FecR family protein n=1 Tax=Microbulbifer sp. 2201CG32-9 TaxID=3232309 RepID=UPI00345B502A